MVSSLGITRFRHIVCTAVVVGSISGVAAVLAQDHVVERSSSAESLPGDLETIHVSDEGNLPDVVADDPFAQLLKRVDELEATEKKRIEADKKKKDADGKKSGDKSDEKKPDDIWTDVSTEKWTVKLGGHVQTDYINWVNADDAITGPASLPGTKDYFEFRRLRLVADGTGYGVLDFRLQMTLEPETVGESPIGNVVSPDVKDAYLSMNEIPGLGRFRIGNFFVPFSLEQVTNDTNNIFMERS
ncbi:MAG: porin, partial [Planctomycetaceae bacterium]